LFFKSSSPSNLLQTIVSSEPKKHNFVKHKAINSKTITTEAIKHRKPQKTKIKIIVASVSKPDRAPKFKIRSTLTKIRNWRLLLYLSGLWAASSSVPYFPTSAFYGGTLLVVLVSVVSGVRVFLGGAMFSVFGVHLEDDDEEEDLVGKGVIFL